MASFPRKILDITKFTSGQILNSDLVVASQTVVGVLYCAVLVRHRRHFPRPRWYFYSQVHFHPFHSVQH